MPRDNISGFSAKTLALRPCDHPARFLGRGMRIKHKLFYVERVLLVALEWGKCQIGVVIVMVTISVLKYHNRNQVGDERVYSAYISQPTEGSQG